MARPSSTGIELVVDRTMAAALGDIVGTVGKAIDEFANSRTSKQLIAFFEELGREPGRDKAAAAHAKLAKAMQDATKRSWGQAKRKLRPANYTPDRPRVGDRGGRDSGGINTIVTAGWLVDSDANGVRFAPMDEMDRYARHWARLNYGAGSRGEGTHRQYPVRFSNLPTLEYTVDEPARKGYSLPLGGFKGPDGKWQGKGKGIPTGAFYPKDKDPRFATKGNVAFHMLDAGIDRFFKEFPEVYGDLFRDVLPSSARRGRPPRGLERHTIRL